LSLNANSNSIKNKNIRSYSIIKDDNSNNYNNEILDLERKISLAKGQEKVDLEPIPKNR
jgi:hypothetical protein